MKDLYPILPALILLLVSCGTSENSEQSSGAEDTTGTDTTENIAADPDPAHNSRNALDWEGVYRGMLPCADCEGIRTEIRLRYDGSYAMARQFTGKSDTVFRERGSFEWNDAGSAVHLSEGEVVYQVGENRLYRLDAEGNRIRGDLEDAYILTKAGGDQGLSGKHWSLVELNGRAAGEDGRTAHLFFQEEGSGVSGNAGCNNFSGTYTPAEGNRITFSPLAATKMACPDMQSESEFFSVLEQTDNFAVQADTLSLHRAKRAPLARFVHDYFH